eukprot:7247355-Heterocapsa_arctica.AAC.1
MRQYRAKQHEVGFNGWWKCTKCEAKGPDMNKKFCSAYTHERSAGDDDDKQAAEEDTEYPGVSTRKDAYDRM